MSKNCYESDSYCKIAPCVYTSSIAIKFRRPLSDILVNFDMNPGIASNSGVTYNNLNEGFPVARSSCI